MEDMDLHDAAELMEHVEQGQKRRVAAKKRSKPMGRQKAWPVRGGDEISQSVLNEYVPKLPGSGISVEIEWHTRVKGVVPQAGAAIQSQRLF